jgi:hypothetical protein
MYVIMCIHMHVCMCLCMYVCVNICAMATVRAESKVWDGCTHVWMHACLHVSHNVRTYASAKGCGIPCYFFSNQYTSACIHIHVHIKASLYVGMYLCMYVCVHIHAIFLRHGAKLDQNALTPVSLESSVPARNALPACAAGSLDHICSCTCQGTPQPMP